MKRSLFITVFSLLVVCMGNIQAKPKKFSEAISWELRRDTLIVCGHGAIRNSNSVYPWEKVAHKIKHLVIKEGITEIGKECFNNYSLKSELTHISLPKSLRIIGESAFCYQDKLKELIIPEGVEEIHTRAFYNCAPLSSLTLPSTLHFVGKNSFAKTNIYELKIPEGLLCLFKNASGNVEINKIVILEKFDPSQPPILNIDANSICLTEPSGNNAIDASETCTIEFKISNTGTGAAYNSIIKTTILGSNNDIKVNDVKIEKIAPKESIKVRVPVIAGMSTTTGNIDLEVTVIEPNGFGPDPFSININTKSFESPWLKITDYAIVGDSGTLKRRNIFGLQLLLQNIKHGIAKDVTVSITVPNNVYIVEGQQSLRFDSIEPGKVHSLEYSMIANNNYSANSIPIQVKITEKYGKYSENRTIDLAFDQVFASNKISVDEISSGPRKNIEIASLSSEVDKNIPVNSLNNNNTFVIIIANENYQNDAKVDYALNDGRIFKEYCIKTLGIPESNIKLSPDATLNNLRNNISWIKDVASVYKGEAEIIFYYAGHGVPDDSSKEAFLLPVDGDGRLASQTGYSLKQLYSDLASCNTKSTIVFMDACFSGAQRNGQMLASARGVVIKAKDDAPQGNMVVFSAASAEQTAHQFADKQHGMFTYFLLKKLQETNGNVTLGDLGSYLIDNVSRESIVRNSKLQTPTVTPSSIIGDWTNIKL